MKPSQASIYRATERLLQYSVGIAERLPKSLPYRVLGKRMISDLMNALDYIVLAFQAEEGEQRLRCIDAFIFHMTAVKTTYRVFVNQKVISPKQLDQFLSLASNIGTQAGAWRRKQLKDPHSD